MAPRHDEIVKRLGDGFVVAWDTTRTDAKKVRKVNTVVKQRSAELGEILGTVDRVERSGKTTVTEAKPTGRSTRKARS